MNKVRKSLDEAWEKYGTFPVEFHRSNFEWTDELEKKYPDYGDSTVDNAIEIVTKDLVPPPAWGFDYANCDGPEEQEGFWEMYEAYEKGQF